MLDKFKIVIPKPCHENWDQMTPDEKGRFCSFCSKSVIDFTTKDTEEINDFVYQNRGQKICGRFNTSQVAPTFNIVVKDSILYQYRSLKKAFLLSLFVVMGNSLFSCKNKEGHVLNKVVIKKEVKQKEVNKDTSEVKPPKKITLLEAKTYEPAPSTCVAFEAFSEPQIAGGIPVYEPIIVEKPKDTIQIKKDSI